MTNEKECIFKWFDKNLFHYHAIQFLQDKVYSKNEADDLKAELF